MLVMQSYRRGKLRGSHVNGARAELNLWLKPAFRIWDLPQATKRILASSACLFTLMASPATAQDTPPEAPLSHFGQPVYLNGANIAWVDFGFDVGTETSTVEQMRGRFQEISDYGGNSARWWLHASGWFSPDINSDGFVRGISPNTQNGVSNQDMIDQVREILDAAWEEGILVTISLLSFDIVCSENNNINGIVYRGTAFDGMLNLHYQSYFDNVLAPLVSDLRDHPALFAWEIFNEADGMSTDTNFFHDHCPLGSFPQSNEVLQRFVNLAAARIHAIDPNVKVTSSTSQTARLGQYTNDVLTAPASADPAGTLDFYQGHWYWNFDHPDNPYINSATGRNLDKPIVMGEFGDGIEPETQTLPEDLNEALFEQGYAGAWIWDMNSLPAATVETAISGAASFSPAIDTEAIEACINSRSTDCYNLLPGETPIIDDDDTEEETDGENLTGTTGNDILIGTIFADVITGNRGNDIINGSDGDDILNGNTGDDVIDGGEGVDTVNGGGGADLIRGGNGDDILSGSTGADFIIGGNGNDVIFGNNQNDVLNGNGGLDMLNGGGGNDMLNGGGGGDTLIGGAGQDIINGGPGNDSLEGNAGGDDLFGGDGNDTLNGGGGNDDLNGGAGADIFVFTAPIGVDRVQDFEPGVDRIDFSGFALANDFADILAAATQVGANVRLDFNPNNSVILQGVRIADLDISDFEEALD